MKKKKTKELRFWNGRWSGEKGYDHIYVAAYSRADAVRLITEYEGYEPRGINTEIKVYWAECWGRPMDGIMPERAIWLSCEYGNPRKSPTKVFPK